MFNTNLLNLIKQPNIQKSHQQQTCPECAKKNAAERQTPVKTIAGTWNALPPKESDDFESLEYLLMAPGQRSIVNAKVDPWSDWDSK